MFTQAGFNPRHRVICYGWTASRTARTGFQASTLIRFEPSGDYAWHGRTFLAWSENCIIATRLKGYSEIRYGWSLEKSELPK